MPNPDTPTTTQPDTAGPDDLDVITVSVKRAAELAGLSRDTIHRMIATGELSSKLVRNRRLVSVASLRAAVTATQRAKEELTNDTTAHGRRVQRSPATGAR